MKVISSIGYGLSGVLQVSVVDKGRVVRQYAPVHNLILNQGLDAIATTLIPNCWSWAVAGTGVTATEQDSGAETATIAAGAVTLSTIGFLAGDATDVGRTIKLDSSGNTYLIMAYGTTTACTVTPSSSLGPDTFIIYNTNQTGLVAESKRTSTCLTGAGNCGTTTTGNETTMTRTFDFSAEAGPVTYNEVGFSGTATVASNLFSRVKLPTGVPLIAGQQLRLKYSIKVAVTPYTPLTYAASPIVGWSGATGTLQCWAIPMGFVATSGGSTGGNNVEDGKYYSGDGEPSTSYGMSISTDATAHKAYGTTQYAGGTVVAFTVSRSVYVAGTYTRDTIGFMPVGTGNRVDWRSFCISDYFSLVICRYLFDTEQTKLSTYTLTLGFRYVWNRVL